eukprot:gene1605-4742_t
MSSSKKPEPASEYGSGTKVAVVDVHAGNFQALWTCLHMALRQATFLALDCELSGLGHRGAMRAKSIQERYTHMRNAAQTRALLSLGIACFKDLGEGRGFQVQVFDVLLFSTKEYVVEPGAITFLDRHGFDFNKHARMGLRFTPGSQILSKANAKQDPHYGTLSTTTSKTGANAVQPSVRTLFELLLLDNRPIIVHNGFLDLVFMYEALYTALPEQVETFLADISDMLPRIYDTKVMAEYHLHEEASYLEYIFHQCLVRKCKEIPLSPAPYVFAMRRQGQWLRELPVRVTPVDDQQSKGKEVCLQFAAHGHCHLGRKCERAHDVVRVVQEAILKPPTSAAAKRRQRRKRAKMSQQHDKETENQDQSQVTKAHAAENTFETEKSHLSRIPKEESQQQYGNDQNEDVDIDESTDYDEQDEEENIKQQENNLHHVSEHEASITSTSADSKEQTAGNIKAGTSSVPHQASSQGHRAGYDAFMTGYVFACYNHLISKTQIEDATNKLYLSGKPRPLLVHKSAYAKFSPTHLELRQSRK